MQLGSAAGQVWIGSRSCAPGEDHRQPLSTHLGCPSLPRCLHAMCAAHIEAMLALLDEFGSSDPAATRLQLLRGIMTASAYAPAASLTSARLQEAVAECLQHIPQASGAQLEVITPKA